LLEKKVDPLGDIVFVDGVVFDTVLQNAINQLRNSSDRVLLRQVIILKHAGDEGIG
jgi:hypothetical protein